MRKIISVLIVMLLAVTFASAADPYFSHVIFANSNTGEQYFYTSASASNTSTLQAVGEKLPVETKIFHSAPNAIRVQWQSNSNGGWSAEIYRPGIRNLAAHYIGDTLSFWCYAEEAIAPADLPLIQITDAIDHMSIALASDGFSVPFKMSDYVKGLPAGKWVEVKIPLRDLKPLALLGFDPHQLRSVMFFQNATDGKPHSFVVDDIKIDFAQPKFAAVTTPTNVKAKGYDRHVDISWEGRVSDGLQHYIVYRSLDGKDFKPVGIQLPGINRYADFLGKSGEKAYYKVAAVDRNYHESAQSPMVTAETRELSDDELLT
ncbi:MAG TPA: hypothetical protein VG897_01110, partial [Terriglobales bacterium]|nr:hypothetical protein [Terriglobales bacterium]